MNEHKCPKCGKNTVEKTSDRMYYTYPAQVPIIRWCPCGYEEEVGRKTVDTDDVFERWKKENQ
jgi:ssDNA-binding Zn-finger/Zn-ribbon topoisomerase 1